MNIGVNHHFSQVSNTAQHPGGCDDDYLISFFVDKKYNSCEATDELIKKIERTQDHALARRALFLYQNQYSKFDRPWNHVTFLYGLGMIYMHFNAYNLATRAFRETVYMKPDFPRAKDIHTRLGLIFKAYGRYRSSEKHFRLAIKDTRPSGGAPTAFELEFHLAHLLELQGRYDLAEANYERLLRNKDLPEQLSANIQRQLGCMYSNDCNGRTPSSESRQNSFKNNSQKLNAALEHLSTSNKLLRDPNTSYYLGRCLTYVGKYQDAFASYRSVIDQEQSTADTWCSIGVLYHRQNQSCDAQQAYIRSVQYDKNHFVAWINLGQLYEKHNQFHDAVKCYQNALRSSPKHIDNLLNNRIKFIFKQIPGLEDPSHQKKAKPDSDKLLGLEYLWNLESKSNSQIKSERTHKNNNELNRRSTIENPKVMNNLENTDLVQNQLQDDEFDCTGAPSHKNRYYLTAREVIETHCINLSPHKRLDINLVSDELEPPSLFTKSPPYPPLKDSKLFPATPSVFLETKKDIVSKKIQDSCQSSPILSLRNFASVLKLDLGLFSTKSLLETNPDQEISTYLHSCSRTSIDEKSEIEPQSKSTSWICEVTRSKSTIENYANYQVDSFRQSLLEETQSKTQATKGSTVKLQLDETESNEYLEPTNKRSNNLSNATITNSDYHHEIMMNGSNAQSNSLHTEYPNNNSNSHYSVINGRVNENQSRTSPNLNESPSKKSKIEPSTSCYERVMSADRIDISDEKRWRPHLQELNKLPSFIRCVSASNILTHVASVIPGINTISMGMHVPGSKILKHIQPYNLCSVNINVGPGDYEWCAVSGEYISVMSRLCNKYGTELEEENWWPLIVDLQENDIPVYRFSQRPGDLVWVTSGTIVWVQAIGWCNNISWNIGPLSEMQYKLAAESVELNKFLFEKSAIPMVQMTWNIIMNINFVTDEKLHNHIVAILQRSLKYCFLVKKLVTGSDMKEYNETKHSIENSKSDKNSIQDQDISDEDVEPKTGHYCSLCDCEIFNILLIHKDEQKIYCYECARRFEEDLSVHRFKINEEYELKYLMKLYDKFIYTRKRYDEHRLKHRGKG